LNILSYTATESAQNEITKLSRARVTLGGSECVYSLESARVSGAILWGGAEERRHLPVYKLQVGAMERPTGRSKRDGIHEKAPHEIAKGRE